MIGPTHLEPTRFVWLIILDVVLAALHVAAANLIDWTTDRSFSVASYLGASCMVLAGLGTASGRPWGRWLAVVCLGLVLFGGVVLLVLLALSAGFLSGVYRDFGKGAALLLSLIIAVVIEIYILVPFVQLWRLLARGAGRALVLVLSLGVPTLLALSACLAHVRFELQVPPPLSDQTRAGIIAHLRKALSRAPSARERIESRELSAQLANGGPVIVTIWLDGNAVGRVEGRGATHALAIDAAAQKIADLPELGSLSVEARDHARIQVDILVARAPFWITFAPARLMGLIVGVDGVGIRYPTGEVLVTADELIYSRVLREPRPFPFSAFLGVAGGGLHYEALISAGAKRARPGDGRPESYFRFRTESFIEVDRSRRAGPGQTIEPLLRGLPPGQRATRDAFRSAAIAGGRYLITHQVASGRYVYEVDLVTGHGTNPSDGRDRYNLPRHAGTTYFLGQLYRATGDPEMRTAVERGIEHMVAMIRESGCEGQTSAGVPYACVAEQTKEITGLGSTALAVVALSEYRLGTGDTRYDEIHHKLLNWIIAMQMADGRFSHRFHVKKQLKDTEAQLRYYAGEAALALIMSYEIFGERRLIEAAERALDALVLWYDFFAGRYFVGEEHWTCIAARSAWPHLRHERYLDFCSRYATFLRAKQFGGHELSEQPDLAGAYGVTPFFVPGNNPVSSSTETMISAYELSVLHGRPDAQILGQVLRAGEFLLRQQVTPQSFWARAAHAHGAIPSSLVNRIVRIDTVQHACSALLRASALLEEK